MDRQFVVFGTSPLALALHGVLSHLIDSKVVYATNERAMRDILWDAGDCPVRCAATHLIHVSPLHSPLSADQLFTTHCRLRPGEQKTATIMKFGPGWSGAILFVGFVDENVNELTQIEPFSKIEAGHAILPIPFLLTDLLLQMANLQPLYPDAWKKELMAVKGLRTIKDILASVQSSTSVAERQLPKLQTAVENLLRDDLLKKLLAHRSVIGALRDLSDEMARTIESNDLTETRPFARRIAGILHDYI